jgi:hypothetical protein
MTKTQKSIRGLAGLFFHTRTGGETHWQGRVVTSPTEGYYLVELFDWTKGGFSAFRLVKIDEMTSWIFYPTAKQMSVAFAKASPPA